MITVERLTKRFRRFTAVNDLSFEVNRGEALALWGRNGAGKSTIIRCVLGLLRYSGRISICGVDARRRGKAARRALGYVPQELCLYDDLTSIELLRYFARLKRVDRGRPAVVLDDVGLTEHAGKRIRELSGGMKQRLALAVAVLADPPVLLLDELTSSLDVSARSGFLSLLGQLKRRGKTILFTTHRVDEVELLADRVLVLERGELQRAGSPEILFGDDQPSALLRLTMAPNDVSSAIHALRAGGYSASPNGRGVYVEVPGRAKASPIHHLASVRIVVDDFEVINNAPLTEGSAHEPRRIQS
jgi:ABC-type multidrug transport system ATPase subunit